MLNKFTIAENETYLKKIDNKKYNFLYPKIKNYIYPILQDNPFFGPNIKKLKGEFNDLYRFRIGRYRLFYEINKDEIIVFIIDIKERKDSYK